MTRWHVEAVLLDMDGTLLDTEKVYLESTIAALNSMVLSAGRTLAAFSRRPAMLAGA